MSHWASPPLDRQQVTLFAPTLDDTIVTAHPVRLFDEVLRGINFSDWESMYIRVVGQPPIHPRIMAAGILYGLSLGIRSSRKLEDACFNRLDFIWLMEGRKPDHATFCNFRTQFGPQLKSLFRKVGRVGIELGMVTLNQVTLDGTDIRANNSRFNTARRSSLEQKLAMLDQQIEAAMAQAQQQDKAEDQLYGEESSPTQLPKDLKDMKRRQEKLKAAMMKIEQMERERGDRKDVSSKGPAVPLADVDSRVLPNKTGGYAPNYTAVLATDSDSGMILDTQVLGGNDEASTVLPAVANIQESFGKKPQQVAADSGFNTGPNLAGLQQENVEPLMPAKQEFKQNPALRPDPSQPVAEDQREALPMNPQNKVLDKAAFVYDESKDCYLCPMGKTLNYAEDKGYNRHGKKGTYRMYECGSCAGCPLASRCLQGKSGNRRVCRDEYEKLREAMARRMNSDEGRKQYRRRSHVAETPHAVIKTRMNFRQFLLRGQKKVEQEMCWLATAYNVMKLIGLKAAVLRSTIAVVAT
jgi:transposase